MWRFPAPPKKHRLFCVCPSARFPKGGMENINITRAARAIQRAEAPYILYADDVALYFRLDTAVSRNAIERGLLGPWFRVEGEPAVLRETLRQHLGLLTTQKVESHKELLGLPTASESEGS